MFLKGCPLNCQWCHNPESRALKPERFYRENRCVRCGICVETCEQGAITMENQQPVTDHDKCTLCGECVEACYSEAREIVGQEMSVDSLMAEIERDRAFYEESSGGVTFSGGEPLNQSQFLGDMLKACRTRNIHTALDTCGYASWETIDGLRGDVDLFLYDLKLLDGDRHRDFTDQSNEIILQNLRKLSELGHAIHLRVPLVPDVNDEFTDLEKLAEFAATLPHLERVDLLPYHDMARAKFQYMGLPDTMPENTASTTKSLQQIAQLFQAQNLAVNVES